MDEALYKCAKKLKLTPTELKKIIIQLLSKETYQEELFELLGFENIDFIEAVCKNKDYFSIKTEDKKTKEFFTEFILPEFETIKYEKELVSTKILDYNKIYFEYDVFNPVQSEVFYTAYKTNENFLVCAPTGTGKTDIALLCILKAIKMYKAMIIYIVPMKALASEITSKFKKKLKDFIVLEFTGDTELKTKDIINANVIVCTPEKFDVYTRKMSNVFLEKVNLVIIDEIHILQEDRGCVIEAIVSRLFRYIELNQKYIRIIGLSATLPNYKDVSKFLKATKTYNFEQNYRPVPLKTSILGVFENINKKQKLQILRDRVDNFRFNKKQILVFVNSRNETLYIAKYLIDKEIEQNFKNKINLNSKLELIVKHKIGIHHAGLPRNIRLFMENKFKNGELDILVCTSTLAWGVNLPAHVVIINGTQFYDPNIGRFRDLGILDIFQIFGRAGRPQYKITGEAILITEYNKVGNYLKMLKNNTPIESKLLNKIANLVNSEIYLECIKSVSDGLQWLKNTFMYIRMKLNPTLYGLKEEDINNEDVVLADYIFLTIKRLEECNLIKINKCLNDDFMTWKFESTEFGRISSFYYLEHCTIQEWLRKVDYLSSIDDIINLILENKDFENIQSRKEEEYQLLELASAIGILSLDVLEYKKYILEIAYLKHYPITHFSLKCDSMFIAKNFERILGAFIDFLRYLKKFNLLYISLKILNKILISNLNKSLNKEKNSKYEISILDCDEFIRIKILAINKFWIILSCSGEIFYINSCKGNFDGFIKKPIINVKTITVEIFDIDNNKFFKNEENIIECNNQQNILNEGFHSCTKKISIIEEYTECDHIKIYRKDCIKHIYYSSKLELYGSYFINISFFVTHYNVYNEFRKKFVEISMSNFLSKDSLLIICKSMTDVNILKVEIYTKIALYNLETNKNVFKHITNDLDEQNSNTIFLTTFEKAKSFKSKIFTIFLTCKNEQNLFYPIFDILELCNNRKVLIFENVEFIDYFRCSILKN